MSASGQITKSEALGGDARGAKSLLEAVSFKKATENMGRLEEESRMPDGSEFQTVGAAVV